MKRAPALSASIALCSFCLLGQPRAAESVEQVLSSRWVAAYDSGDSATLSAIYATEARIQHGYCEAVEGRNAIEAFWRADLAAGGLSTTLEVIDSFTSGEIAYLSGTYRVLERDGEAGQVGGGSYTQIWRRDSRGDWSVLRESWNNFACLRFERGDDDRAGDAADLSA